MCIRDRIPTTLESDRKRAKRGLEEELEALVTAGIGETAWEKGKTPPKKPQRPPTPPIEKLYCGLEVEEDDEEGWDAPPLEGELTWDLMTPKYSCIPPSPQKRRRQNWRPQRGASRYTKQRKASGSNTRAAIGESKRSGLRRTPRNTRW